MPQSTAFSVQPHSHLRLVRDEDAPPYDGMSRAPSRAPAGPFAMTPHRVIERMEGDGYALAVFLVLVKHADKHGRCWPSVATVCKAVGWSKKIVSPAIDRLIAAGILTKEPRFTQGMKSANLYRITAYGRMVPTAPSLAPGEPTMVPTAPSDGSHSTIELEPIELDTSEREEDTPLPPVDFDAEFRPIYPKGRSSWPEARRLWAKLSPADQMAAVDAIPAFLAGRDWQRGYHPAAEVFLRRRRWEDPPEPWNGDAPTNGHGHGLPTALDFAAKARELERQGL